MAVTRALACVVRRFNVYIHNDDENVCFMHACLLGGRCFGHRCRALWKYPGALCGGCVCQKKFHLCTVGPRPTVQLFPMFKLLYCLAHLHNFIYLLMCICVILYMSLL